MLSRIYPKVIAIIGLLSFCASLMLAYLNPATGYELSIYNAMPMVYWILIFVSLICGIVIILISIYYKNLNNYWGLGFLILLLTRLLILYTPFIRGYFTYNGDNITHIGTIKDILTSGHIQISDFYPITHILIANILYVSNLPIMFTNYATGIMSIFYILFLYVLSKKISNSDIFQKFTLIAAGLVIFNAYEVFLMPNGWSILYLPLVVYILFLEKKSSILLLLILLGMYPFFHPLSSIVLILILIVCIIIKQYMWGKRIHLTSLLTNKYSLLTIYLIIISIFWILSFKMFHNNIINLYNAIIDNSAVNPYSEMSDTLSKLNVHGFGLVWLALKLYGHDFIYMFLSLLIVPLIFIKKIKNINYVNLYILLIITFATGLLYIGYQFNIAPGLANIGAVRFLRYMTLFCPLLVSYLAYYLYLQKSRFILLFIMALLLASIISFFSLYPSPITINPNPQITQEDIKEMSWLLSFKDTSIENAIILNEPYRYSDLILGASQTTARGDMVLYPPYVPNHFNYPNSTLGAYFKHNVYVALTNEDAIVYLTVWKSIGRFTVDDFNKFNNDNTVNIIYSNKLNNIYYVTGTL